MREAEITVLIADDHPLFRAGLRQAIETDHAMHVVGEASDGAAALEMVTRILPDVAILDIGMPKMNGLEVARALQKANAFVAVMILTHYREEDMFNEAMDAGVRGYVLKDTAAVDIRDAIRTVTMGRYYISPSVSEYLVTRSKRAAKLLEEKPSLADLTPAERRVLGLIALNKTSKEIAEELNVSYKTIETHRTNIASKLNIHGSHSLLKFALENKSSLLGGNVELV
jgi:DNA-binding NarL/FixJ family response regulator